MCLIFELCNHAGGMLKFKDHAYVIRQSQPRNKIHIISNPIHSMQLLISSS